ncbi:FMN reductase [NAD(P)H] [Oxobacter pfennigii]|uniref:FMN reductase [NAD(P)H] n=1 Tax=Oxobacter pfennigii TaxID=36849 RepID=A0A0P8W632_9CLOT|nr:nitroreductase family protein [Oxobacter pfennigii]KPU43163.1 FMN reductase [NAD(P)H] [Oxobacter pfennigii]
MNETLKTIYNRKSVRVFEDKEIAGEIKTHIIKSAMRAPTAGNMMLYTIIEVAEQSAKETLAETCDNQPFIAKSPFVLLFLADYQRWYDYYIASGVPELCGKNNMEMRKPGEGDLFLACCDALIAAQNAVIAAESLGLGSCYIGDIMENYEAHKELFGLPRYTFPIAMVCFGYPTEQQVKREQPNRFDERFIVFKDKYKSLSLYDFEEMFKEMDEKGSKSFIGGAENSGQHNYLRKFSADFSIEMTRSVREILKNWK